jgi:hypothetical protein
MGMNTRAGTDARHSRAGKDASLFDGEGNIFAQVDSFSVTASFNNYEYTPLGQNRVLEANNMVGVKISISEIVVLDGDLFMHVMDAVQNGESPVLVFQGVIEGRNGSQERVVYRECLLSGDCDIQNVTTGDVIKRSFNLHCNGAVENTSNLTI